MTSNVPTARFVIFVPLGIADMFAEPGLVVISKDAFIADDQREAVFMSVRASLQGFRTSGARNPVTVLRYLLDTNICIYTAKHRPPDVAQRFAECAVGEVGMSLITFGELRFSAEKS